MSHSGPSAEEVEAFRRDGFLLRNGLFSPDEVAALRDHYMALRAAGPHPGDFSGAPAGGTEGSDPPDPPDPPDPLRAFPRMIHMHRWDTVSLRWLLDARLARELTGLLGEEPLAVQTMLYFKPPGARGQALHQDQFYLRAHPGTCVAAWLALDAAAEENGCMRVVPGTGDLPVLCTQPADTRRSFTDVEVPMPPGLEAIPVRMEAGDVLYFNGSLVHGSFSNSSPDRFRRALIGHYITGNASEVAAYYHPVLRMDGTQVRLSESQGGGECGRWVEQDGRLAVTVG